MEWRSDLTSEQWDRALAELGGHPLQSALWGDARREVDGIRDHRWMALQEGRPIWMIRIEERPLPLLGWVGWAPRGPTGDGPAEGNLLALVGRYLKKSGLMFAVTDPWRKTESPVGKSNVDGSRPKTIWLDLSVGEDVVWRNFHSQMRKGVRRAETGGVVCRTTREPHLIQQFVALCAETSVTKGFELRVSEQFVALLLAQASPSNGVEAALFIAEWHGHLASGLFVIRVGKSFHQIWGATSREYRQERPGEAVQWAAMKWAFECGCRLYDLEGIDPENNRGVYEFKSRMAGAEVELQGKKYYSFSSIGRVIAWLDSRKR